MNDKTAVRELAEEWNAYLTRHGHTVGVTQTGMNVLTSQNGRGTRYRWILRSTARNSILLTKAERKYIRRQLRLARNAGERAYIVVRFDEPVRKLVVIPATEAFSARRVNSVKGGIPWDE